MPIKHQCPQCNSETGKWDGKARGMRRRRCKDCGHVWVTDEPWTGDRRSRKATKPESITVKVATTLELTLETFQALQQLQQSMGAATISEAIAAKLEGSADR